MKAAVWHKKEDIRIEDVGDPKAGPGQVKVRIKTCGICGSDLHEYKERALPHPHQAPPFDGEGQRPHHPGP